MKTVLLKQYAPPPIDKKEILRYAGVKESSQEMDALLESCLQEVCHSVSYGVCYREFPIIHEGDVLNLSFTKTSSKDLQKNLAGCKSIILFAATIGINIDRLTARYSRIEPARGLMINAIGAERIESLVNAFNRDITKEKEAEGLFTVPRFSPGYGDLSLSLQRDIFSVLDCPRKIGLTLNDSLLMSPSKSVTAMIGVTDCQNKITSDGCSLCKKTDCTFRRNK